MPMMDYMNGQLPQPELNMSQATGYHLGPNPMQLGIDKDMAGATMQGKLAPAMNSFTKQIMMAMQHQQAQQQQQAMQQAQSGQFTQGVQGVQQAQQSPFASMEDPAYFQLPPWAQQGQGY